MPLELSEDQIKNYLQIDKKNAYPMFFKAPIEEECFNVSLFCDWEVNDVDFSFLDEAEEYKKEEEIRDRYTLTNVYLEFTLEGKKYKLHKKIESELVEIDDLNDFEENFEIETFSIDGLLLKIVPGRGYNRKLIAIREVYSCTFKKPFKTI